VVFVACVCGEIDLSQELLLMVLEFSDHVESEFTANSNELQLLSCRERKD